MKIRCSFWVWNGIIGYWKPFFRFWETKETKETKEQMLRSIQ